MKTRIVCALLASTFVVGTSTALAQTIAPEFAGCYSFTDLGSPQGVPTNLGGITFLATDPNVILIGGAANAGSAAIYSIRVTRNSAGSITGFDGAATLFSTAPNIDGGLAYGPGNVLFFTQFSNNGIGQIKPGSTTPDLITPLSPLGFASSTGTLNFVPEGFPGAGRLKVASYSASIWYDATLTPRPEGTFDIVRNEAINISIGGGPEGIVYVGRGNPNFTTDSVLVSEFSGGRVVAYDIDANADPIVSTRRVFITGLSGAEGGTRDPVTGEFLFSTFGGGNRVIVVRGFNLDCRANVNGDCSVDFFDYLDFVADFEAEAPNADFNGDNTIDFFDYLDFVNDFATCGG
jgi:hypothetical protein